MKTLRIELPSAATGRLGTLDELKGLAILLVVIYHAGGVLGLSNRLHADLGVDIFVVLSGVGLSLGSTASSAGEFFRRRLVRIVPAYWIILTLCLLANTHFLQKQYSTTSIALHYLGIHAWFGDTCAMEINDSFWFITYILTVYVFFWLARGLIARPDRFLLVGAVCCTTAALALFFAGQSAAFGHMALRLPGFLVGVLLGRLLREGRLDIPLSAPLGGALLLLLYVPYTQGIQFGSLVISAALVVGYACLVRPAAGEGLRRGLRFVGDRSLEIFLIHQPLIREYNVYLNGRWFNQNPPSTPALVAGLCVGGAVALLASIELHELVGRLVGRRRAAAAA